ncbi:hypothetical protein DAPPUDRAFT_252564 [Daphnia pulex]|uniref:Uncharacterized protein n=1 Tax=Daphnia pulex TaxID=6669 RepID=E9H2Z8_DAPPU|nr:hypothetical protein DAPPUDRAFT_252564 [Daphnia pulex]|eukprot:EFX73871.1 hypothetical protein DAPPUDRAFT_252564 [Daphnia pulex]
MPLVGEQSEDPRRVCHKANPDVAPFTSLMLVNVDHRHTLVTHPRTVSLPPSPPFGFVSSVYAPTMNQSHATDKRGINSRGELY